MRKLFLILTIAVTGFALFSCSEAKKEEQSSAQFDYTMRDIMKSMVEPRADSLWNAVSTNVTDKGTETKAPANDEEWAKIRAEAVTLNEAMNSVLMPGRRVARPGEQAKDPKVELTPEQIEAMINMDRETFAKLARVLQDKVNLAVKAIDKKDVEGLSSAGGDIDAACETCHKKYWYPNDDKAGGNAEKK